MNAPVRKDSPGLPVLHALLDTLIASLVHATLARLATSDLIARNRATHTVLSAQTDSVSATAVLLANTAIAVIPDTAVTIAM